MRIEALKNCEINGVTLSKGQQAEFLRAISIEAIEAGKAKHILRQGEEKLYKASVKKEKKTEE